MKSGKVALYTIAILLIILGNKSFWNKLVDEWKANKKLREQQNITIGDLHFEIQKLEYNNTSQILKNNSIYIQTIRIGNHEFKKIDSGTTRIESGNLPENASESK